MKNTNELQPDYLNVINESHRHNVPEGSESHFKIIVTSQEFEGRNLLARHRRMNEILADELKNHIHALALHTFSPKDKEWQEQSDKIRQSPPCPGGSS